MVARATLRPEVALTALAFVAACAGTRPLGRATEAPAGSRPDRTVEIAVTSHGFEPKDIPARVGETVELVFTRRVGRTCVTRVILWLAEGQTLERDLPLDVPVSVTLALVQRGDIGFACPMHMYGGRVDVQ